MSLIRNVHPEDWDGPEWRPIPYFPNYWISEHGLVFNMKRGKMVAIWLNNHNIKCVRMYRQTVTGSRGYIRSVRKIMREVFPYRGDI